MENLLLKLNYTDIVLDRKFKCTPHRKLKIPLRLQTLIIILTSTDFNFYWPKREERLITLIGEINLLFRVFKNIYVQQILST